MFCKNCGSEIKDGVKFCPSCGEKIFTAEEQAPIQTTVLNGQPDNSPSVEQNEPEATTYYNTQNTQDTQSTQNSQNYTQYSNPTNNQAGYNPNFNYPLQPQYVPKKKHTAAIIISVVAAVFVGLIVFSAIIGITMGDEIEDIDSSYSVDFTTGEVEENAYTNEFANLKFDISADFIVADDAELSAYGDDYKSYAGFAATSTSGNVVMVMFEDLSKVVAGKSYDEEKYADATINSMNNGNDYNLQKYSEYEKVEFGGSTFTRACIKGSSLGTDIYENIYFKKIDDYMVSVIISGPDISGISKTAEMFTKLY